MTAAPSATSFLNITAVSKTFRTSTGDALAIRDVSLGVKRGEFVALIGHSGCGKSTLLNIVAGLYPATEGVVTIDGRVVREPGADRGMVFQNYSLLPWLSVRENVFQAVDSVFEFKMTTPEKNRLTDEFLQKVGLAAHRQKRPHQLSGGMQQRVAIARAFALKPEVLLLDEPFGALDALTKGALHEELLRMWRPVAAPGTQFTANSRRHQTVLMVTHDIDEAIYLADRIVVMTNGPAATIGEVLAVNIPRPRDKRSLVHLHEYADLKERLLELLTETYSRESELAPQLN